MFDPKMTFAVAYSDMVLVQIKGTTRLKVTIDEAVNLRASLDEAIATAKQTDERMRARFASARSPTIVNDESFVNGRRDRDGGR